MPDDEACGLKSNLHDVPRFLRVNLGDAAAPPDPREAVAQYHAGQVRTQHFQQAMIWERYPRPVSREQLLAGNATEMVMESQPATRLEQPDLSDHAMLFSKTGSTNGFGGFVPFIPAGNLGLVILTNRNIPNPARVDVGLALIQAILETGP